MRTRRARVVRWLRAARRAGAGPPRGPLDRPGPDDGRLPRRPPLADAARARARPTSSSYGCSSTPHSSTTPPTSPPTHATRRATPSSPPTRASTTCSRPPRRGRLPARLCDHRLDRRVDRQARGRPPRPRALRRRHDRRHQDAEHGRARRRLLRTEGRPAGGRGPAAGARPQHAGPDRGLPHDPRSPTASRCRAATRCCRPPIASGPPPCTARWQRVRQVGARRRARPRRRRAAGLAELSAAGIEPDYLELVDADTLAPVHEIDGEVLALVAAQVGPARLIDNDLIRPRLGTMGAARNDTPNIDDEVATPHGAPTTA